MATLTADKATARLAELDQACEGVWKKIMATRFYRALEAGTLPKEVMFRYFVETFHYVRENAKNQAAVVLRLNENATDYARYCLKHALEENGHENMCLNDLRSLGFDTDRVKESRPLPTTAAFIGFLYDWADRHNPVGRLGYSYFAEGAHTYLGKGIELAKQHFGLTDQQLTFFVQHGLIDEKHFADVQEAVVKFCKTDKDWEDVKYVIGVTGSMTAVMLEELFDHPLEA